MTAANFAAKRRIDWERLASLCVEARRLKSRRSGGEELAELARLYRRAVADLGRLRTLVAAQRSSEAQQAMVDWLNALVARAHAEIYVARPLSIAGLASFLTRDFPARFRRSWKLIAFAAGIFLGSTILTYALCANDIALARSIGGAGLEHNAHGFGELGRGHDGASDVTTTAFYISNNVKVAFMCFALGISAGVGTLYALIQNGITMGVTLAFVHHAGDTENLITFIASHGSIELLAIFVAAAAGMSMGHALIVPGPFFRAVALRRAAVSAVTLVLGAACLLLVAAFFEGFISPSSLPMSTKWLIGGVNAAALVLYFAMAGRAAPNPKLSSTLGYITH